MEKFHFFSRNKTINECFFVRLIESLFKVRLSGLLLYICYAVGNALVYGVPTTGVIFASSYLIHSDQPLQQRLETMWFVFIMTFLALSLTSFVSEVRPSLLAWLRSRFEKRIVAVTSILSILALIACIVLSIKYFPLF